MDSPETRDLDGTSPGGEDSGQGLGARVAALEKSVEEQGIVIALCEFHGLAPPGEGITIAKLRERMRG